jgi:hypothetical protein
LKCPKCKNKGFTATEDVRIPIVNYGKDKYDTIDRRYYFCVQCGTAWLTTESFERYVEVRINRQESLKL